MASAESEENLSDLFDSGFKQFTSIQNTQSATNSLEVQLEVKKCISVFETATKLVSLADMFSRNEEFSEIPTENIKYFLLPALLGTLATKICDRENRMHYLKVSEVYFYDFLERVKSYGVVNVEIPKKSQEDDEEDDDSKKGGDKKKTSNLEKIEDMVSVRKLKLMRYKEQKELKDKLEVYQKSMDNPNLDDETKRNYFTTLINLYALEAVDELNSLKEEKAILEQMKLINPEDKKKDYKPPKLQPIIITKNQLQKQVLGAGYPSLPVMTVEEFYEKKIADGEWAAPGTNVGGKSLQDMAANQGQEDPEVLEKEQLVEKDDEDHLQRMRAMDEYKDTHKRGWGNRYNRS
ncbi:immunoglobulin binding protein Tap42 [Cotesia typhae]|uniref:immunoglobulin binding protein Tap42 n=1 Tax=Cotesia typhae TaxID=2053667 RepID=UPI003D69136B